MTETVSDREPENLQIEGQRPVFNVVKIVLDSALQRSATPPAVYLSPPRHTGPYPVPEHVAWDVLTELFYEERTFRTWPDHAQITAENVKKLWQLVQAELPEKATH